MNLLSALQHLLSKGFPEDIGIFSKPYAEFSGAVPEEFPPFDLPPVLVPPEVIEIDSMDLGGTMYEDTKINKREELPHYYLTLFDNEVNLHVHPIHCFNVSPFSSDNT